ncbi:hypothetical Protein YC6258_01102 [Gynuella sunshinyii YC6258]|uniref:Uncharacterized protein n=1 Tax=Gynuella sunshinyii YC6258 TaxID=1445510 RepID=A0A0C5V0T7_9GAMM|nr:hypothetical Protein YC6258_01102 [Gynuella sunshinyii YC6258]
MILSQAKGSVFLNDGMWKPVICSMPEHSDQVSIVSGLKFYCWIMCWLFA